jgi:glycosyltransferase involved in cell wall biosynthesis
MLEVFSDADVAVFPDRHGLGIRNSVTEALSAGLPVVATQAGAREQQPHPLLSVAESEADLIRLLRTRLTEADGPASRATDVAPAPRPWETVAAEYLDECRSAMTATPQRRPADQGSFLELPR